MVSACWISCSSRTESPASVLAFGLRRDVEPEAKSATEATMGLCFLISGIPICVERSLAVRLREDLAANQLNGKVH